ncbi:RidA family protein [Sandaracinus amylolyticus]|uniref:Endoribonuclease L-PSP n=1 Tax=Sandaracinus amylolyticus TaxID=927083 RepID=A0A0F6YMY7_9BACT|nr:RidA family protein [Sandaracinus amylolyticus]AKF11616.1 Endoribonuclease L-PSP [Sandaracinus amylolyticus]
MPVELIHPSDLFRSEHYAQVAVATGTRTVYLAGQVAYDEHQRLVGTGDLAAQTEQATLNVGRALAAAGATFADVAKLTIYVTRWTPERMPEFVAGFARAAQRLGIASRPPTSLIGVQVLYDPEILIEIEGIAVLP